MSFTTLLSNRQKQIWERERELIQSLLDLLEGWESSSAQRKHLQEALNRLSELFLLVVVGEFNSGKSALINAFLGDSLLVEGVTPTTDRIHIVQFGQPGTPEIQGEDIRVFRFPSEILRQIHIVDTPGTNAVLRHHEAIVREFIPRSDMVIFVTSADRPFTESEREFLETIRKWGKKIIVVVNKIDILQDENAVLEVRKFVEGQVERLLDFQPAVFTLSARLARVANEALSPAGSEGFQAFREYVEETLSQEGMIKLKLLNPLGVAYRITVELEAFTRSRLEILASDSEILSKVEHQLALFKSDTESEFERHLDRMEKDLLQMQLRGEEFIDDKVRILNLPQMLRGKLMQSAFERDVVADTPKRTEKNIQEIIDWLVERELRQWRMMADELGRRQQTETLQDAAREASGGFSYNRRQLLDTIGHRADEVLRGYDRAAEAERLTMVVKESIALVGLVEVGAISLGLILKAVLTTAAADATGILAAGILGVLGLTIIPFRRGQAKRELRSKMNDLQKKLRQVLSENFLEELDRAVNRLNEALAPYRRFVHSEEQQVQQAHAHFLGTLHELQAIQLELDPSQEN